LSSSCIQKSMQVLKLDMPPPLAKMALGGVPTHLCPTKMLFIIPPSFLSCGCEQIHLPAYCACNVCTYVAYLKLAAVCYTCIIDTFHWAWTLNILCMFSLVFFSPWWWCRWAETCRRKYETVQIDSKCISFVLYKHFVHFSVHSNWWRWEMFRIVWHATVRNIQKRTK
jgi:hypothetical protein